MFTQSATRVSAIFRQGKRSSSTPSPGKRRDSHGSLLFLLFYGSLLVLLIALITGSTVVMYFFVQQEKYRSSVSEQQFFHSLSVEQRAIDEELWTRNFDSVNRRIFNISSIFGDAAYELAILDSSQKCLSLFKGPGSSSSGCDDSESWTERAVRLIPKSGTVRLIRYDQSVQAYIYVSDSVISNFHLGYIAVKINDPYHFSRHVGFGEFLRFFLIPCLIVLAIWSMWFIVSKKYLIKPYLNNILKMEKDACFADIAAKVAHDIRSPLAALDMAFRDTELGREQCRKITESSLMQIRGIADNLLAERGKIRPKKSLRLQPASVILSSASEKVYQLKADSRVSISADVPRESWNWFVNCSPVDLQTVLSNLINNSAEAMPDGGHICLNILREGSFIKIQVRDDGDGIPPDLLKKLRKGMPLSDKFSGHGLGLAGARSITESLGGQFSINSDPGVGTVISFTLPLVTAPAWFLPCLLLTPDLRVCLVDDNPEFFNTWKALITRQCPKFEGTVSCFRTPESFLQHLSTEQPNLLSIIDFEFLNSALKGTDVIQAMKPGSQVILTSGRQDPELLRWCRQNGIKFIPKDMLAFLPAEFLPEQTPARPDICQLEDDPFLRHHWQQSGRKAGLRISSFSCEAELNKALKNGLLAHDCRIFIDRELGRGQRKGEQIAADLARSGFKNLCLSSEYDPVNLPACPWIKAFVGKQPPWSHYAPDSIPA